MITVPWESTVPDPKSIGDWNEWGQHVLKSLDRQGDALTNINRELQKIRIDEVGKLRTEVELLKLRASVLGAGFGGLVAVTSQIAQHFLGK